VRHQLGKWYERGAAAGTGQDLIGLGWPSTVSNSKDGVLRKHAYTGHGGPVYFTQ
jgi:hypothetical protein